MKLASLIAVFGVAASACIPTDPVTATSIVTTSTVTTETTPTVAEESVPVTAAPVGEPDSCFPSGAPLEQEGFMGRFESPDTDSQDLAGVTWTESGDCAAVTLSFRTSQGAPAVEPPGARADFRRHTGVIRLELDPSVTSSVISSQVIDTALMRAVYVAVDPATDSLAVDLHLWSGVLARVQTLSSPSRVVIELERGGPELIQQARIGGDAVVFYPAADTAPIVLEGYVAAGATTAAVVSSTAGQQARAIESPASPTAWALFSWTIINLEPGFVEVAVGEAPMFAFTAR